MAFLTALYRTLLYKLGSNWCSQGCWAAGACLNPDLDRVLGVQLTHCSCAWLQDEHGDEWAVAWDEYWDTFYLHCSWNSNFSIGLERSHLFGVETD